MRLQEPIETVLSNPHPSEALKSNIAPKKRCDAVRQHDASTKSDIPEPRTSGEGDRDEEDRDKEARAERRDAGDRAAVRPNRSTKRTLRLRCIALDVPGSFRNRLRIVGGGIELSSGGAPDQGLNKGPRRDLPQVVPVPKVPPPPPMPKAVPPPPPAPKKATFDIIAPPPMPKDIASRKARVE
eukprot:7203344-Pyramimonas_sp.AAC.1